jgi:hypothetical protein
MKQTINVNGLIKKIIEEVADKPGIEIKRSDFYKQLSNLIASCPVEHMLNFPAVNPKDLLDAEQNALNA